MLILDTICPRPIHRLHDLNKAKKEGMCGSRSKVKDTDRSNVRGNNVDGNRTRGAGINGNQSERIGTMDTDNTFHDDECPLVRDFGPRKYGMSQASWILIILSRRCAEKVIMMNNFYAALPTLRYATIHHQLY